VGSIKKNENCQAARGYAESSEIGPWDVQENGEESKRK
jgi:hypothetical protein